MRSDSPGRILLADNPWFRLSRRPVQVEAVDHLPEVDSVPVPQTAAIARDRFKIHPRPRDRTVVEDHEDALIRLFDARM